MSNAGRNSDLSVLGALKDAVTVIDDPQTCRVLAAVVTAVSRGRHRARWDVVADRLEKFGVDLDDAKPAIKWLLAAGILVEWSDEMHGSGLAVVGSRSWAFGRSEVWRRDEPLTLKVVPGV